MASSPKSQKLEARARSLVERYARQELARLTEIYEIMDRDLDACPGGPRLIPEANARRTTLRRLLADLTISEKESHHVGR